MRAFCLLVLFAAYGCVPIPDAGLEKGDPSGAEITVLVPEGPVDGWVYTWVVCVGEGSYSSGVYHIEGDVYERYIDGFEEDIEMVEPGTVTTNTISTDGSLIDACFVTYEVSIVQRDSSVGSKTSKVELGWPPVWAQLQVVISSEGDQTDPETWFAEMAEDGGDSETF